MTPVSVGDLSRSLQLRRNLSDLQGSQTRLTGELSSGLRADPAAAMGGDHRRLAAIDRSLELTAAWKASVAEAQVFSGAVATALGTLQAAAEDTGVRMLSATNLASPAQVDALAAEARERLGTAVAALNTQAGGRYVMSGTATDTRPLVDAGTLLSALGTAITGQVTVSGIEAAVTAWFDAPAGGGGYLDLAYGGNATPPGPFALGEGEAAAVPATAADQPVRDTLRGLALAALVAGGTLAGDPAGRAGLVAAAGRTAVAGAGALVATRAEVGVIEERIADAGARADAAAAAFGIARSGIVAADPYETAAELTRVQSQIETLYALTARLSRLSLTDWLR
ncbi:MAG: flagellin [Paracoccaceae bacterium]